MGSEQERKRERERGHFARRREGNTLLLLGEGKREKANIPENELGSVHSKSLRLDPGTKLCDGTGTGS